MSGLVERDLIVVGAGVVGLSTALAAADAGLDVRCVERARPGAGQSAGRTRVFRHRHRDPRLMALAIRARAGWSRWEERFRRELVGPEGALMTGAGLEDDARRMHEAGLEVREVDARTALPIAGDLGPALLDAQGGAIRVDGVVEALAGALGDRLVTAEVVGLHPDGAGVAVATTEGLLRARRAVVCAGADTARLALGLDLTLPLRTACHVRATFAVRAGAGAPLACLLDARDGEERAYASSFADGRHYTVGLLGHDPVVDALRPAVPAPAAPREAVERTSAYVARTLPGLDPDPVGLRLCWTTKFPWDDDAFAVWQVGGVTLFAGSNLFKMAPALGEMLLAAAWHGDLAPELVPPEDAGA